MRWWWLLGILPGGVILLLAVYLYKKAQRKVEGQDLSLAESQNPIRNIYEQPQGNSAYQDSLIEHEFIIAPLIFPVYLDSLSERDSSFSGGGGTFAGAGAGDSWNEPEIHDSFPSSSNYDSVSNCDNFSLSGDSS